MDQQKVYVIQVLQKETEYVSAVIILSCECCFIVFPPHKHVCMTVDTHPFCCGVIGSSNVPNFLCLIDVCNGTGDQFLSV
jgi:hypothetical protein